MSIGKSDFFENYSNFVYFKHISLFAHSVLHILHIFRALYYGIECKTAYIF